MAKSSKSSKKANRVGKNFVAEAAHGRRDASRLPLRPLSAGDAETSVSAKTPSQIASQEPSGLARILRPAAAQRWTMPMVASMTPQYVEQILRGTLSGNHVQQWELFDMMLDTWPELAGCQAELTEGVMAMKPVFTPWAEEGEAPTPGAIERQQVVSSSLRRMAPDVCADENDFDGTIRDLADGWFRGVVGLETDWHRINAGKLGTLIAPRATFWAHPSYFAWGDDGRIGLRSGAGVAPFPPHKFLLGVHKAKSGSPLGGALLRPLAWWWCASNFASDWVLNLAQLFGLPFRWANYDPNAPQGTVDAICNMLQNMGSAGWAAFPAGTTLELKDAGAKGDNSPQADLLDRADRYARMVILGQTMSGSQDSSKGGGKAFGSVEADVKSMRVDACGKYICGAMNTQMIPSIVEINYGDREECPVMTLVPDSEAGPEEATRDETLSRMMPIPMSYLRSKYNVPEAGAGEETTTLHQVPSEQSAVISEEDISAKLSALAGIDDDALFAKQLTELTHSLL